MYSNVKTLLQNERHPEFYSLDMETDNRAYLGIKTRLSGFMYINRVMLTSSQYIKVQSVIVK